MLQRVYRLFDNDDESTSVANLPNSHTDGTSQNQVCLSFVFVSLSFEVMKNGLVQVWKLSDSSSLSE